MAMSDLTVFSLQLYKVCGSLITYHELYLTHTKHRGKEVSYVYVYIIT